jgi:hypothetical protein
MTSLAETPYTGHLRVCPDASCGIADLRIGRGGRSRALLVGDSSPWSGERSGRRAGEGLIGGRVDSVKYNCETGDEL